MRRFRRCAQRSDDLPPDVARWEIPSDGDRQTYTVIVRDAAGAPIYTATLTFTGLRLSEAAG